MKPLPTLLALSVVLASASSHANLFNYSYTFHNGAIVSGTLEGTQIDDMIEDVKNVTAFFQESSSSAVTAWEGPMYMLSWNGSGYYQNGGAIVSFNALKNNFWFVNTDVLGGIQNYSYFIEMDPIPGFIHYVGAIWTPDRVYHNAMDAESLGTFSADRWSLTAAGVPDAGSTAAMLGVALGSLSWLRRKAHLA